LIHINARPAGGAWIEDEAVAAPIFDKALSRFTTSA
jgi:hypothetical protein